MFIPESRVPENPLAIMDIDLPIVHNLPLMPKGFPGKG